MKAVPLDPSKVRIADGAEWALFEETPDYRRYSILLEDGNIAIKTEFLANDALIEQNRQSYNDSFGKSFGDGKIVASIPLNKWSRDIAPRLKDGDTDFVPWYLDRDENLPFRTFRGKIRKK